MGLKQFSLLFFLFILGLSQLTALRLVSAQEPQYLEDILEQAEDEEAGNADWLEYLWELRENPLDLNTASIYELNRIPFLSTRLTGNIIKHRRTVSGFKNLDELKNIDGFDEELLEALRPFVTVKKPAIPTKIVYRFKSRVESPSRRGFRENIYQDPLFLQHRVLFSTGSGFSGGILWEKDAGEENYFDFGSYHIRYRKAGKPYSILVGDYQVRIGCGLASWSAYGMPLSAAAIPVRAETESAFTGNRSSNEIGYLRGIALQTQIRRSAQLQFFYSKRNLDANFSDDGRSVTSLYASGLHRTETEKSKIGVLQENLWGISAQKEFSALRFQLSTILTRLTHPYQDYGTSYHHLSLSYNWSNGAVRPGGELALFQGKFPAIQQYLYFNEGKMKYEMAAYYYHPEYLALRGRAFGSLGAMPMNKAGAAIFLAYRISAGTQIGGYMHYSRKLLDYEANPFLDRNYNLEIRQRFGSLWFKIQYWQKYRENDVEDAYELNKRLRGARLGIGLKLDKNLNFQNRVEIRWADPMTANSRYYGTSLFHHVNWQATRRVKIVLRWTSFDIPDYDLRIYEFEPDLPGSFRISMLNDRGYKWLALIRLKPNDHIQFDLKYQQRYYPDLASIGSGYDEIDANRLHDFRISVIWKY